MSSPAVIFVVRSFSQATASRTTVRGSFPACRTVAVREAAPSAVTRPSRAIVATGGFPACSAIQRVASPELDVCRLPFTTSIGV
ncbi:MAG: hypothetical protein HUU15_15575 [Candidatus Brocadiae bacterium]|nr:hypothetical protein [Candidatus Brocadiia bacterium]